MEDGLLKAFTNLENYTEKTSFGAWLKRIMINQCLDTLKKKRLETISLKKYSLEIKAETNWNFDVKIPKK
jgi:RNA polymerase sigma-70 factor (ECF subfamily)